jgi:hypothetical protein
MIRLYLGTSIKFELIQLACRTCILVLHAELTRLLELQHNFRQLSYFDLMGRSRLTIQLTRVTISLPIAMEKAIQDQNAAYGHQQSVGVSDDSQSILPRHINSLICAVDVILEHMERVLK